MIENLERKIMLFIIDNPGLSKEEIAEQLNMSKLTLTAYLKKLVDQGELKELKVKLSTYHAVSWEEMINWKKIPQEKRPLHLRDE